MGPEVSGIAVGDRVVGFPRQGQTAFQKFLEMDGLFVHKVRSDRITKKWGSCVH